MDCSMPGFPVPHHLPEFAQVHVHWISDAIQPSHPLLPPSSTFSLFQYQGLFQWVKCLHQVLELQIQHQNAWKNVFQMYFSYQVAEFWFFISLDWLYSQHQKKKKMKNFCKKKKPTFPIIVFFLFLFLHLNIEHQTWFIAGWLGLTQSFFLTPMDLNSLMACQLWKNR